jgi:hydroxymethylpyrimidine pyrophosphatase-like HAD family hydrolase
MYRDLGFPDPVIGWDGAETYESYDRRILDSRPIPLAAAREILHLADTEDFEMSVGYTSALYRTRRPGQTGPPPKGTTFAQSYSQTLQIGHPLRFLTSDPAAIEMLPGFCSELSGDSCRVQAYVDPSDKVTSLGIYSSETSKGNALHQVCQKLEIGQEEVMAIGDNWSDKPMLEFAGVGVTMGNAPEGMRQEAEFVAPTNDEEGVRWAVERFSLFG